MTGAIVDRRAAVRILLPAFRDPGLALLALQPAWLSYPVPDIPGKYDRLNGFIIDYNNVDKEIQKKPTGGD